MPRRRLLLHAFEANGERDVEVNPLEGNYLRDGAEVARRGAVQPEGDRTEGGNWSEGAFAMRVTDDEDGEGFFPSSQGGPPPRWKNLVSTYILNPYGVFAIAAVFSVTHPGYIDRGRENLAMQLYNRDQPGFVAYKTKNGGVFKVSKESGGMSYNGKNGMIIDSEGGVWLAVPRKDDPQLVKEKYYVGQIEDVPLLPDNPTKEERKMFEAYMQKTFGKTLPDVPNLRKVYELPDPKLPLKDEYLDKNGDPLKTVLDPRTK